MSEGTVLDRLLTMQNELISIEQQCCREQLVVWPLVPIMHEVDAAIDEYQAKAYGRTETKLARVYL